jgi:predicted phosphate transport protein (TIGR00153 family)
MGVLSWMIPQEKQFFDMIENQSVNVLKGVNTIADMLENYTNLNNKRIRIKNIEHEGDRMVHDIHEELNKTFITPIDREDITALVSSLDDILDYIEAVAERLLIYNIEKPPYYMIKFAKTLQKAMEDVNKAISLLRNMKKASEIRKHCRDVNTCENEGDVLLREAMAELFKKKDAIEIIKLKELYDNMETAIDKCEDAVDVIGNILVKYA